MTTTTTTRKKKTIRWALVALCLLASVAVDAFRQGLPVRARSIPIPASESKAVACRESRDVLAYEEEQDANSNIGSHNNSNNNSNNSICVLVQKDERSEGFREEAQRIADRLGIPLISTLDSTNENDHGVDSHHEFTHTLQLVPYEYGDLVSTFALAIEPIEGGNGTSKKPKKKKKTKTSSSAFFVDLCPPSNSKAGRRAAGNSGKADLLVKAVAPAKGSNRSLDHSSTPQREGATVWDWTAGLGQDALVLAHHGAQTVVMVERHPIVAALLQDAMRRLELVASQHQDQDHPSRQLWETLDFRVGDGRTVPNTAASNEDCDCDCDVVYLDPMFPPRQKQSAVKKGMSILHGLLETHVPPDSNSSQDQEQTRQTEEQELMDAALAWAKLRVVVKRPAKAPLLGDGSTKPSHVLTGSVNRWDVYVKPPPPPPQAPEE